ncbi:MAG: NADH-ubiquinone oxidoreductase-F iron-sulfur binding region domain-containing protein, partial [Mycobacterium sp.]
MTPTATDLTVAAWPECAPRLLRPAQAKADELADYVQAGGYVPLADPDALLEQVDLSGLLGRGGGAFPLGTKLRTVRDAGRRGVQTVIVANGEEGEPASVKDRWLLRNRPHLVLDGLRLAAAIVNASRAYVYVSDQQSAIAVNSALSELDSQVFGATDITVLTVEPGYVAGEETAAVRRINGGPAKPTDKPPRPFEEGVSGLPTTISNVETLAHLPHIHRHGSQSFRALGTPMSPGTFLATITGGGRPAALYEIPHGAAFSDLLTLHGVTVDSVRGVLMGGY